jgi:hypothetical protein
MNIFTQNGISISMSGTATQVVLFAHGGYQEQIKWKPSKILPKIFKGRWKVRNTQGYGFTTTPYRLYFYTGHGNQNGGVLDAIKDWGAEAVKAGLDNRMLVHERKKLNDQRLQLGDDEYIKRYLALPKNVASVMNIAPAGCEIWNYRVSGFHHEETDGNRKNIRDHQLGAFPSDIDMVYISDPTSKFLSDVFAVCQNSGANYELFHYAPCRHSSALNDPYYKAFDKVRFAKQQI